MIEESELPNEWEVKRVADVAEVNSGSGFSKKYQGHTEKPIPFYKVGDMPSSSDGVRMGTADNYVDKEILQKLGAGTYPAGSVIFPKTGEAIHTNKKRILQEASAVDNNVMCVTPDGTHISTKFLFYVFQHTDLGQFTRKTTVPSIRLSDIRDYKIPVPSLEEQEQIVDVLDRAFDALDTVEELNDRVGERADEFIETVLHNTFNPEPENEHGIPEHWEFPKMEKVCKVILGNSPPGESYNEDGNGMPFIQGASGLGETTPESSRYTTEPSRVCEPGDTIICIRATLGDLNTADKKYCLGRGVAGIRTTDQVLQEFVHQYLNYKNRCGYWERQAMGATFKSITKTDLQELRIPLPPLEEQSEIVAKLEQATQASKSAEVSTEELTEQVQNLKESILHQAFRGKLPTDFEGEEQAPVLPTD